MIDPFSLAIGGLLVIGGWAIGQLGRPAKPKTPASLTVCSCEHGYGTHDKGGRCRGQIKRDRYKGGDWTGHEWVECPCQGYDGPEPLPRVWTELES